MLSHFNIVVSVVPCVWSKADLLLLQQVILATMLVRSSWLRKKSKLRCLILIAAAEFESHADALADQWFVFP